MGAASPSVWNAASCPHNPAIANIATHGASEASAPGPSLGVRALAARALVDEFRSPGAGRVAGWRKTALVIELEFDNCTLRSSPPKGGLEKNYKKWGGDQNAGPNATIDLLKDGISKL